MTNAPSTPLAPVNPAAPDVRRITGAELHPHDLLHTVTGIYRITQIRDLVQCRNLLLVCEDGTTKLRGVGARQTVLASRPNGWGQ